MGNIQSRTNDDLGATKSRRRCLWCRSDPSFETYDTNFMNIQSTTDTNSRHNFPDQNCLEAVEVSAEDDELSATANSSTKRKYENSSSDSFPYSHFTQETLFQIIRCFPFQTSSSSSSLSTTIAYKSSSSSTIVENRRHHHRSHQPKLSKRSKSDDLLEIGTTTIPRSNSANYDEKSQETIAKYRRRRCNEKKLPKKANSNVAISSSTPRMDGGAIEKLAMVSVDTMAITALPLDCWLKERLKKWIQLSGHEGTIVPATDQTLWKRRSCSDYNEGDAYRALMLDKALEGFAPRYYREVEYKDETFIEIEDLTSLFDNPSIMDIKMGTRTFLESEVKNNAKRCDLYNKMMALCPNEPTLEEQADKAITKMRYMQFREKESSTSFLGFRIEAAKMPEGALEKSFKKIRTREEVLCTLWAFLGKDAETVAGRLLLRLKQLLYAVETSEFFKSHEVIGSSLLLMYDATYVNVWMIDFAKAIPVERGSINHRNEWKYGNHEDGFLFGLDNLISIVEELLSQHEIR